MTGQAANADNDFPAAIDAFEKEFKLHQDIMSAQSMQAHFNMAVNMREARRLKDANIEFGKLEAKLLAARKLDRSDAIVLEMLLNTRVNQCIIYTHARANAAALNAAASLQELLAEWVEYFEGRKRFVNFGSPNTFRLLKLSLFGFSCCSFALNYMPVLANVYGSAGHLGRAEAVCREAIEIIDNERAGNKEMREIFERLLQSIEAASKGHSTLVDDARHGSMRTNLLQIYLLD